MNRSDMLRARRPDMLTSIFGVRPARGADGPVFGEDCSSTADCGEFTSTMRSTPVLFVNSRIVVARLLLAVENESAPSSRATFLFSSPLTEAMTPRRPILRIAPA